MFAVIFLTSFMVRMGQGIIPAIVIPLRNEFDLTNTELGTLGSLIYAGGILGSLAAMPCLQYFQTKNVILTSVVGQILSLVIFMTASGFVQQSIARFFAGFWQVFMQIIAPVWVETQIIDPNQ